MRKGQSFAGAKLKVKKRAPEDTQGERVKALTAQECDHDLGAFDASVNSGKGARDGKNTNGNGAEIDRRRQT